MFPPHLAAWLHTTVPIEAHPIPHPDGTVRGPFTPGAFSEWIGHAVTVPGLDTQHTHRIAGVDISDDGCTALLQVRTDLTGTADLATHFNVSVLTPEAHLRLVDHDTDAVLLEGSHSVPLVDGAHHRVNGDIFQVVEHCWPERHPEHGCVQADPDTGLYPRDVQEVRVRRVPDPAAIPMPLPPDVAALPFPGPAL